jgi:hypothetical protein
LADLNRQAEMSIHRSDVVGQKIQGIRCAVSETPGDMGGGSASYNKTAILLENGIGIDLELHEPPLLWCGWPASLQREKELEAKLSYLVGREVQGIYRSEFYPCLVVLIEGNQIVGMNSPAPWLVIPTVEFISGEEVAYLEDFFSSEERGD